jgi:hypothetical protein
MANTDNTTHLFGDYMFPTSSGNDSMHYTAQLLDFSNLVQDNTSSTSMALGQFTTMGVEDTHPRVPLGTLFGANHIADTADMAAAWTLNVEGECTCHGGVTELLASMRGGASTSNDPRPSLDAQLAKLKRCIVASEMSMGCAHGREDSEPIHIMTVAMLIGYVIDDFKMLANESSLPRPSSLSSSSSSSTAEMTSLASSEKANNAVSGRVTPSNRDMSFGGFLEPRLSWGVLELEDDDEMDLRQRLYLLSFRKLERLLSQLTLYLRDLHNAWASLPDPSRHIAFVTACDYTRMWLEKKAVDVKRLFSVPTRDDTMMDLTFA